LHIVLFGAWAQQGWWLGSPRPWVFLLNPLLPRADTCEEDVTMQRVALEGWGKQNWKDLCACWLVRYCWVLVGISLLER